MLGTDTLTASHTGGVVSGQPCDVGAHRRNIFNELLDRIVVLELRAAAVRTGTEFDLEGLIDLLRLWPASARMSALASRALGCHGAFLGVATERSSLAVRGALGFFERRFQLSDAF